ncbi:hypothetical protein DFA_10812 [Cavenderia fasciculata]|uniref:Inositol-pentakisphosphate 2-kinase n=1 Tax=Cavenderia fasciculata TaxID=261658 RepID=F4QBG6_CACFS|nr:uncharacterized protein DFA_10812 [Cavenderia fasciculata]EGG14938.1 hypothetical protein DFA_10812 [Cavenderia fasciculata]|eukprot:XP_004351454.1 hypothetical protein DFA_10812 [Cavenderia fasciculata]
MNSNQQNNEIEIEIDISKLKLKPQDWSYKGEGACNIVVYYNPQPSSSSSSSSSSSYHNYLKGKVLRLKKKVSSLSPTSTSTSPSTDDKDYRFVQNVMQPLIGSKYVNSGVRVSIDKQFINELNAIILGSRPQHRIHHQLDDEMTSAILIRDISLIHTADALLPSICVEIKPKCGFISTSKYISKQNIELKQHVCRYCMHQLLKLKDGSVDRISKYCPIDLYSLDRSRQLRALDSLIDCPQNNLKVFKDGVLYFTGQLGGGGTGNENGTSTLDIKSLDSLFNNINILEKEKQLLINLAQVQREYDPYDIETIYYLYCKLHNQAYQEDDVERFKDLSHLTNKEMQDIIERFLIATTAKDCSIMITFKLPLANQDIQNIDYIVGVYI